MQNDYTYILTRFQHTEPTWYPVDPTSTILYASDDPFALQEVVRKEPAHFKDFCIIKVKKLAQVLIESQPFLVE
jgi:hypothetical protein